MSLKTSDLFGAWAFVSWSVNYDDGRITRPLQPNPGGLLIYDPSGLMSVVMHTGDRKAFATANLQKVDAADKASAFDSYFHYSGTWFLRGQDVVHEVTAALNTNMIGTQQVRHVDLEGDSLTLSAVEPLEGGRGNRSHRLTWRRVGGGLSAHH